jgi:hypothetical protein
MEFLRQTNNGKTAYCLWCHQAADPARDSGIQPVGLPKPSGRCPRCQRGINLVTINTACASVGVTRKTMYHWIEKGIVKTIRISAGRQLICFSTLFAPNEDDHNGSRSVA